MDLAKLTLPHMTPFPTSQLSGFPQRPTPLRRWRMPHARWVPAENHTIRKAPMGSPCDISICLRGNVSFFSCGQKSMKILYLRKSQKLKDFVLWRFSLGWTLQWMWVNGMSFHHMMSLWFQKLHYSHWTWKWRSRSFMMVSLRCWRIKMQWCWWHSMIVHESLIHNLTSINNVA